VNGEGKWQKGKQEEGKRAYQLPASIVEIKWVGLVARLSTQWADGARIV
jgi:hypothetical protein